MSENDRMKAAAAEAALDYVESGDIVGIGTGSTVDHFIDRLATIRGRIDGVVASSERSRARLSQHDIPVHDLNRTGNLPLYVDGADECTQHRDLIKGGGGALTGEKIVAEASDRFICVVDATKVVGVLGKFPLPVEVLPMARSLVARRLTALGGQPTLRENFVTDHCNIILDVHNLKIENPVEMETRINQIPGVVTNGLFAHRKADVILVGAADGIQKLS